jgi:signal transduction histidine kinase
LYIIEPYLVIQDADDTTDPGELQKLEDRFSRLHADYQRRYSYWKAALPEDELKTALLENSYAPAMEFFDIAEKDYFPARHRGDRAAASSILQNQLRVVYERHRSEIDRTVVLARAQTASIEADTTRRIAFWMRVMVATSLISALSLSLLILKMRTIEELIIHSEKMNTVAGLAAGMAHEINNPLAGVLQGTQVVITRVSPEIAVNRSTAEECGTKMENIHNYLTRRGVREMLEAIRASGQRAAEIVSTMLSFSGKNDGQMHEAPLAELLDAAVELARNDFDPNRRFDFRDIQVVREYDPKLSPVPCRANEIQQVLLNLFKNASQAMPDRGTRSDLPRIIVRTSHVGNTAKIEVEDNGPGIPRAMKRRVFEPFFTTRGAYGGTGLGLFISYFIITRNRPPRSLRRTEDRRSFPEAEYPPRFRAASVLPTGPVRRARPDQSGPTTRPVAEKPRQADARSLLPAKPL